MQRITLVVPSSLVAEANALHVALGKADADTYAEPSWSDGEGNLFCVSSGPWTEAQRDQAVVAGVVFGGSVDPHHLTAVESDEPLGTLTNLGLVLLDEGTESV